MPVIHNNNKYGVHLDLFPLRVAMISVHGNPLVPDHELGSDGKGGQNIYVREVGIQLSLLGCDVTWLTRSESSDEEGVVTKSDTLRCQYIVAGPQKHINRDYLYPHLDSFISQIDRDRFDVVFSGYWLSGFVGMSLGLPQAHIHHSMGCIKYQHTDHFPLIALTRLQVERLVNQVADVSFSQTEAEFALTRPRNGILLPCGIKSDFFKKINRETARTNLSYNDNILHVLYVGRFAPQKGIKYAIEAMKNTSIQHQFRMVGNCENEEIIRENQQIEFLGTKSPQDVVEIMTASDILIMPSLYEPYGLVAIEAMAAGCCLIVSSVGGLDENVKDRINGLKVKPADSRAIQTAFEELAQNRHLLRSIQKHNREYALKKYSWKGVATEVKRALRGISVKPMKSMYRSDIIRKMMEKIHVEDVMPELPKTKAVKYHG